MSIENSYIRPVMCSLFGPRYPRVVWFLKTSRYIDIFVGAHSLEELQLWAQELIAFMLEIGIKLDKWAANMSKILSGIQNSCSGSKSFSFDLSTTVLRINWNPSRDEYFFTTFLKVGEVLEWTNRSILPVTSQAYDPSGSIAPVDCFD